MFSVLYYFNLERNDQLIELIGRGYIDMVQTSGVSLIVLETLLRLSENRE